MGKEHCDARLSYWGIAKEKAGCELQNDQCRECTSRLILCIILGERLCEQPLERISWTTRITMNV